MKNGSSNFGSSGDKQAKQDVFDHRKAIGDDAELTEALARLLKMIVSKYRVPVVIGFPSACRVGKDGELETAMIAMKYGGSLDCLTEDEIDQVRSRGPDLMHTAYAILKASAKVEVIITGDSNKVEAAINKIKGECGPEIPLDGPLGDDLN